VRSELIEPIADESLLNEVVDLAHVAYQKHEVAQDLSQIIERIAHLANASTDHILRTFTYSFGSVSPDTFARNVLTNWDALPKDLSKADMLELVERICSPQKGQEFLSGYWIKCLALNTGNKRVSDLLFWPDVYFDSTTPGDMLSPAELLDVALRDGDRGFN
jgi:hypothetical protein